ncbi:hypothetical protein ILUMI_25168 [Ignelater luminosus]|uniref:RNA-binding region-containing protein 3 n=1 Tax=Ignelater luminosus TaxID=2038154 RepID=A0A8K0CC75_IGNLU|nr:hypothetical protein ILUMI_25168 [Ignelater luminosus]
MVCEDILRIKNLPKELSTSEKEDFLLHFGATQVKILTSNMKQKSTAYAKFTSKEIAKTVMLRLHQITVLTNRLCVEYAEHDFTEDPIKRRPIESSEVDNKKHFKSFINKLNAWNSSVSFYQPPPPYLKYVYPKPNRATINNIAHALASVPKFYTQVLHLMNKMNLPPPFSDVPDPPQMQHRVAPVMQPRAVLPQQGHPKSTEASSESEIESDLESSNKREIIPKKRTLSQKKVVKRPKFIKPNVAQANTSMKNPERSEDVFEKVDMQSQKKIEVKVSADSLEQAKANQPEENVGSFGIMASVERPSSPEKEADVDSLDKVDNSPVITEEELAANRIPTKDLNILPVFKNYHPGAPTCRLYIKNIAKTVELKELEFIYRRYIEDLENKESQFDIKLMQEGKMKGQAFVTLDSVQLAQKAIKETNGYILKDKPLVVVFARSAVPKK